MTDVLDQYCMAQTRPSKWALCLQVMHTMRKMILQTRGRGDDIGKTELSEPLVDFDLLKTLSRPIPVLDSPIAAAVSLARDKRSGDFVIVKQYAHTEDDWHLSPNVLRQLYCSCRFLQSQLAAPKQDALRFRTCIQNILDVQISKSIVFIVFKFYPVMFEQVFQIKQHHDTSFKLRVIDELVLAVHSMHQAGIAHRDIKVENLAFDKRSRVVLIDFDSGAQMTSGKRRSTLSVCSLFTRPPEHFAEFVCDQKSADYDAFAADWWSTGCVIAQLLLLGQHLFEVRFDGYERDFLNDMQQFCSEFGKCFKSDSSYVSTHVRVKELMRAPIPQVLRTFLHGVLQFDDFDMRNAAASDYVAHLQQANIHV